LAANQAIGPDRAPPTDKARGLLGLRITHDLSLAGLDLVFAFGGAGRATEAPYVGSLLNFDGNQLATPAT
jgi:hypothetical protein